MTGTEEALSRSLDNLSGGAAVIARGQEKRLGYLSELADTFLEGIMTAGEATSVRSLIGIAATALSVLPSGNACERTEPGRNRYLWDATLSELAEGDRALFARIMVKKCKEHFGHEIGLSDFADGAVPPPERSRTVYVRNPLSDRAYQAFSGMIGSPTVGYRQGFRELLDDVEHGYADYAVLPLFSGGARIGSVFSLLEDYGLHVAAVTVLDGGEEDVTFALLAREAVTLSLPNRFLFSLTLAGEELAGVLAAMRRLEVLPRRFEATPLPYENGRLSLCAAVGGDERSLIDFLTYLSLFWPGYVGYGFYTEPE